MRGGSSPPLQRYVLTALITFEVKSKRRRTQLTTSHTQIAEADLAAQARNTASSAAKGLQSGTKMAADGFNNFVEGSGSGGASSSRPRQQPERKDFWDAFGEPAKKENSSIGTAAMRKGGGGEGEWEKW